MTSKNKKAVRSVRLADRYFELTQELKRLEALKAELADKIDAYATRFGADVVTGDSGVVNVARFEECRLSVSKARALMTPQQIKACTEIKPQVRLTAKAKG